MKKVLSLLVALIMLMSAVALAEGADLAGDWYLVEGRMDGISLNAAMLGMDMTVTLNPDGTAFMSSSYGGSTDTADGTWEKTETGVSIMTEAGATEFVLEDGFLMMYMDEANAFVLGREKPVAEAMPADVAADSEDAFLGTWTATNVAMMGMVVPAEVAGMSMTMVVEPGKITITTSDEEPDESPSVFADGALIMTDEYMGDAKVVLTEDGGLRIDADVGEDTLMQVYFVRAE